MSNSPLNYCLQIFATAVCALIISTPAICAPIISTPTICALIISTPVTCALVIFACPNDKPLPVGRHNPHFPNRSRAAFLPPQASSLPTSPRSSNSRSSSPPGANCLRASRVAFGNVCRAELGDQAAVLLCPDFWLFDLARVAKTLGARQQSRQINLNQASLVIVF